MLVINY